MTSMRHSSSHFAIFSLSAFGLQRSQGAQEREESNQQAPRAPAHPAQGAVHSEFGRIRAASPPGEPCASRVTNHRFCRRSVDQLLLTFVYLTCARRYRNNQLLEVLAVRKVPLLRATWYIKIVQLNNNRQKAANKVLARFLLFIYIILLCSVLFIYLFMYLLTRVPLWF
jgi:hypothetical protein